MGLAKELVMRTKSTPSSSVPLVATQSKTSDDLQRTVKSTMPNLLLDKESQLFRVPIPARIQPPYITTQFVAGLLEYLYW